jgi:hypothetical protein
MDWMIVSGRSQTASPRIFGMTTRRASSVRGVFGCASIES